MSRIGKRATDQRNDGATADRDSWTTPAWITEALGPFDLDPCSNARSLVRAQQTFELGRGEDGLALATTVEADMRVFINPPYSSGQVIRWAQAYAHTRFCFLLRFDPSTAWFRYLYQHSQLVCVTRKRVNFDPPPGVKAFSNVYPHCLFFARLEDASEQIKRLSFAWRTR
jgi:hypothetical protein